MAKGIGIVGLGDITGAHRTGYHGYGLPVVAGFSRSAEARGRFAEAEPNATAYDALDALLADPAVAFVDLTTVHTREARLPYLKKIAAARKPVLIQKPLAMSYAEAVEVAELLERTGTPGMVN